MALVQCVVCDPHPPPARPSPIDSSGIKNRAFGETKRNELCLPFFLFCIYMYIYICSSNKNIIKTRSQARTHQHHHETDPIYIITFKCTFIRHFELPLCHLNWLWVEMCRAIRSARCSMLWDCFYLHLKWGRGSGCLTRTLCRLWEFCGPPFRMTFNSELRQF